MLLLTLIISSFWIVIITVLRQLPTLSVTFNRCPKRLQKRNNISDVLLVEDKRVNREVGRTMLELDGFKATALIRDKGARIRQSGQTACCLSVSPDSGASICSQLRKPALDSGKLLGIDRSG